MNKSSSINIIWFRADLRIRDNPALIRAMARGIVRGVFVVCLRQWLEHGWGTARIGLVLRQVMALRQELMRIGVHLDVLVADNFAGAVDKLSDYARQVGCVGMYFNAEYELNERRRDELVASEFTRAGVLVEILADQCLVAPGLVMTTQGKPYTVFTPFKRACYGYLERHMPQVLRKPRMQEVTSDYLGNLGCNDEQLLEKFGKYIMHPVGQRWQVGEEYAHGVLRKFCEERIGDYKGTRDFPGIDGTSKLSPYLALGVVSVRHCFALAMKMNNGEFATGNEGIVCWVSELLWRDFYRQIIWHFPDICKGHNFNRKYDGLEWRVAARDLQLWQEGRTGVPIVDAAMRQLVQTGWMHNRLRMIVAMFLTKHLLLDWRLGEHFFAQHLVDLDFASNNGGWQWSASTGTDAVPYFRVFNPVTQSEKFDEQGEFIKQYCPELRGLEGKVLHNPSAFLTDRELRDIGYVRVMVDLKYARERALQVYGGL